MSLLKPVDYDQRSHAMTITHGIIAGELLVEMRSNIVNGVLLFSCILLLFPYIGLAEDIPLIKKAGVYELPVEINGVITLNFILDTAASDVNIPVDVALTLLRAGTIRDTDFLPGQTYRLADGSLENNARFVLRHLKIGQRRIDNVSASVGKVFGSLLLGQSFLEKLGSWGIDSQKQVLVLGPATAALSQKPSAPSSTVKPPALPPSRAAGKTESTRTSTVSVGVPDTQTGDTYVIEYLDPDNPKSRYSTERKVVSVGGEKITVASKNVNSKTAKARILQFTSEWNLLSSRHPDGGGFDYAPPLKYFDFPLYLGKTWQQTSRETDLKTGAVREHTVSATVGEWEEITVPAGTFRALKITIQTTVLDRATEQKSTGTDISWYAPTIRRSVKSEITSQNFQGQQERQVIQLMQYDLKENQAPIQDSVAKASGREERQGHEAKTDAMGMIPVLGNTHKAVSLVTQMVTLAMQNGGEGQEAQLDALQQQIEALPKPKRGDRKAARPQNDQGLEAFKKEQYEQALQSFLTAYQLDASDVEVVNNIGLMYLKTGNLEEAARYLGGALSLAPNRATAWANLAEVFAHGLQPEEAVAAYALTYRFSKNKDTTRRYLEAQTTNAYDPLVMQAAKAALALSLLK
jgi:Flp pilus assembly protein TadD